MTATTTASRVTGTTGSLVRTGAVAGPLARAATTVVAGNAAGISLDVGGAPIPAGGFAVLTAVCSLIGLVLAAVLSRVTRRPRSVFIRTTVALTALSLVPDVIVDAAPATRALLML